MRYIIKLTNIPYDDQYRFRQRAQILVTKWQQPVSIPEDRVALASTNLNSVEPGSINPDKTKGKDPVGECE